MIELLGTLSVMMYIGGIILVYMLLELNQPEDKWWERILIWIMILIWPIPLLVFCVFVLWNDYIRK